MGAEARIVTYLGVCIVLAAALRLWLGPVPAVRAPESIYASAKLGGAAHPFAVQIEMAVSGASKPGLAD